MVETERHGELVLRGVRVTDAVRDGGRAHLADRNHTVDAGVVHELLEIFMHMRAIRVVFAAIAIGVVLKRALADEVHDIKAEALHAACPPETQYILQFLAHGGIFPVQIRLRDIKEMQVGFIELWYILPGRTAEFRLPVRDRAVLTAVAEDIVILIFLPTSSRRSSARS